MNYRKQLRYTKIVAILQPSNLFIGMVIIRVGIFLRKALKAMDLEGPPAFPAGVYKQN
jgi:hypothetical protein